MNPKNVSRRVWTDALVKVVLRCKIFLDDNLARGSIARRQFRGLSDWLERTRSRNEYLELCLLWAVNVVVAECLIYANSKGINGRHEAFE